MLGINLIRYVASKDLCPFCRLFLHSINNFFLLYRSFLISWSPICRSLAFSFKQLESYSGSVSLCPILVSFPYVFSLTVSEFQISHSGLWFIWSWVLCMVREIQIHPSCVLIQVVLNHLLERLPFLLGSSHPFLSDEEDSPFLHLLSVFMLSFYSNVI